MKRKKKQIFADAGVMAIEHADFEGVERLAAVTGGATASTFDHPELAVLGECKKIEEVSAAWRCCLRCCWLVAEGRETGRRAC